MTTPTEISIEMGLRFNENQELEFFGLDDVNSALRVGYALASMEKGRALMVKTAEDDENVRMKFNGFSVLAAMRRVETAAAQDVAT